MWFARMTVMSSLSPRDWDALYTNFDAPISRFNCGQYCAPLNDGEPICCSTQHVIPVMFVEEWELLNTRTRLWHAFWPSDAFEQRLLDSTPPDYRLAACSGAQFCERENRALSCRAFPFFPYVTRQGAFIGLSYYWTYEDRCWVISNLTVVDDAYRTQFVRAFDRIFERLPDEREAYRQHSASMRRVFSRKRRQIPLLHRDGGSFWVTPGSGELAQCDASAFPTFEPFLNED